MNKHDISNRGYNYPCMCNRHSMQNEVNDHKGLSRRDFIKNAGIALAAAVTLPPFLSSCIHMPEDFEGEILQGSPIESPTGPITIGIARSASVEEMVRSAIDIAGGLYEINQGDTVIVKVNLNCPFPSVVRYMTNPEVLRAVLKVLKEKTDASNITVADATAFEMSTMEAAEVTGILAVCQAEGVHFLPWELNQYVKFNHPAFFYIKEPLLIPESLKHFDHFVNVPILKNHEFPFPGDTKRITPEYTCCLKHFVGVIEPSSRMYGAGGYYKFGGFHNEHFPEIIAELNLCVPTIAMNIVDATQIVLTGGPYTPNLMVPAESNLILASKDRVACDSLAVAVLKAYAKMKNIPATELRQYMNKSVWDFRQIINAGKLNLGRTDPDLINIEYDSVDNIDDILEQWS